MASIDIEDVLSKLKTSDKIALLSGIDFWHTHAVKELGIPSLRFSDGPNGVRGTKFFNGVPAACFPCGTAMGATWDKKLLHRVGVLKGKESIAKGAHVILGPTINMHRGPLGGRGFESLSEDPVLAGLGSSALINGIQETGVAAALKHFVCNDQEHERNAVDSLVTMRALREIYLLPFQLAVKYSNPRAFMTAYNKVNGTHASENPLMLTHILRGEWKWSGLTMSDWFGTYSTGEAVKAGLSLEMPGPPRLRGALLAGALTAKKVTMYDIDNRVREVLGLVNDCSASGIPEDAEERTSDTPETARILREVATDSIVLMKNKGNILPLSKNKKTLVIGPNAKVAAISGGGSASMLPYYAVTPFDGISEKLSSKPEYTVGCYAHKELPLLGSQVKSADGKAGFRFKAFKEPASVKERKAVDELHVIKTDMFFADYYHSELKDPLWYAELDAYYEAETDGEYEFGVCVHGLANLYVDGKLVVDNTTSQRQGTVFFGTGTLEETAKIVVQKGKKYHIKVEFTSGPASKCINESIFAMSPGALRLGGCPVIDGETEVAHAALLAESADQVIVCAGLNADWEGEGNDRIAMSLPGLMDEMIFAVAAVNPNTVVVMQSGTPVDMTSWIGNVPGLIHAWFGGNETGNSIADVLFGDVNPSAKLPLSFPVRCEDNPAFLSYRSERGRTLYGEDIYIGYRHYEALKRGVLFPFGHGLSYTSFAFSGLKVKSDGNDLTVSVTIQNTGGVAGAEVVQVYISQQNPSIRRPVKELKGYEKVFLDAGASTDVEVQLATKYATSFWDEERDAWIIEKDTYKVIVCNSSAVTNENSIECTFDVEKTTWWNGV